MVDLRKRPKKVAVALVTAGVVTLGGTATAVTLANADPTPEPSAPAGAPSGTPDPGHRGPGGRAGHGPLDGALAEELASKLGISEAKVTSALKAVREDTLPAAPKAGEKPDPMARQVALAKALAKELGIDEAEVTKAFADIKTAHQADEAKALETRLDAAVRAGTLTRSEADAVLKAAKAGVIGYGHR